MMYKFKLDEIKIYHSCCQLNSNKDYREKGLKIRSKRTNEEKIKGGNKKDKIK